MKEPNKKSSTNCDDIEQLLIKRNIDGLTQNENLLVEKHLKFCERCKNYQSTLLNLQESMQIEPEEKLIPDPAIRQNIIQRMRAAQSKEQGIFQNGWQYIRTALEYRIPVYQTLLGIVLIFLISLSINRLFLTPEKEPLKLQSFAQIETLTSSQMSVIENLDILDQQKIGRTVKEDPSLTRFTVTTR
jgi:hypothetical protein